MMLKTIGSVERGVRRECGRCPNKACTGCPRVEGVKVIRAKKETENDE